MNHRTELHIDELVLHGFSPHQRYAIAQAIEVELTRLFTEKPIPVALQQGGKFPSVNAGCFNINKESKSEATGNKIAYAVYKSFGK
ncbi:hypothetical protein EFY79_00590 [Hanamia caeni]|jgi:hypothetical protein|uniref:Uncharacterized protein n=1 Tax=Hanamia caeni TaxID=2294116 RepID=A0A3M9NQ88_9BACT|nr:hypothetical protein [Hanamia caeni]RNI39834.1 hypothetical protein EFY79_00590 [Hanamia caeni]